MATIQVQLRRGTAAQVEAGTPVQGEPWVDTTNNRVCIGDGSTAGGWAAAKLSEVLTNASGGAGEFMATPAASSGAPSLRAMAWADLPTPTVTAYTVSSSISVPGLHLALTAGITLTLPSPSTWSDAPLIVKDRSGSIDPLTLIAGTIDGNSAGLTLRIRNQAVMLVADPARSTWQIAAMSNQRPNPIASQLLAGLALDLGPTYGLVTDADDFGAVNVAYSDSIDLNFGTAA